VPRKSPSKVKVLGGHRDLDHVLLIQLVQLAHPLDFWASEKVPYLVEGIALYGQLEGPSSRIIALILKERTKRHLWTFGSGKDLKRLVEVDRPVFLAGEEKFDFLDVSSINQTDQSLPARKNP
jgi:hypothetical protein